WANRTVDARVQLPNKTVLNTFCFAIFYCFMNFWQMYKHPLNGLYSWLVLEFCGREWLIIIRTFLHFKIDLEYIQNNNN
ncbi:hypothetical protein, partial [Bergeyella sp. RCAD1439]|uniref:hypothetical protein n=1 Tax=Bergeyella anatis TaxID=3113737 RepID=UPI002E176230|nr:hypothetical protein [Bergeyella sp. RCAD1439]